MPAICCGADALREVAGSDASSGRNSGSEDLEIVVRLDNTEF